MFNNQRFITKGVISEIPVYLQNMLWYFIETMDVPEKDYLQVFELQSDTDAGHPIQKIIHHQEQPAYKKEMKFKSENAVTAKIFVIDDNSHTTMLLATEY